MQNYRNHLLAHSVTFVSFWCANDQVMSEVSCTLITTYMMSHVGTEMCRHYLLVVDRIWCCTFSSSRTFRRLHLRPSIITILFNVHLTRNWRWRHLSQVIADWATSFFADVRVPSMHLVVARRTSCNDAVAVGNDVYWWNDFQLHNSILW